MSIFDDGALLARLQLAYRCAHVRRVRVQSRELWDKAEGADLAAVACLHADADDGAEPNRDVVADASDMLDITFQRLQGHECHTVPVVQRGDLVGLLTMDNVGEFLSVQAALEVARPGEHSQARDSRERSRATGISGTHGILGGPA